MRLFHGSPSHTITEFSIENPRFESVEGTGVYLTTDYRIARGYAGSEGCVYVCELKDQAIFDATNVEEFEQLLLRVGKFINFNVLDVECMNLTVRGLVSGQYQITNEQGHGLNWQVRNVLLNNEAFCKLSDYDEKLEEISTQIQSYLDDHSVVKYMDKRLGLVFVCRNPSQLKIVGSIVVGSDEEIDLL